MSATATLASPHAVLPFPPARPKVNKWLVTVSITFGTLMGALDASVVNVALSHIRGTVGATIEEITWISTAYVVATVLVMPLTAFLGSFFGQKRAYMFCLGLFLVGSALCGLARSLTTLIIFRCIQGFGAGALQPTEQAILRQTFPKEEQGMAMAIFGMAVMIGPALGPTLGGFLTDRLSWPWIFYVNIPIGILGLAMVQAFVHESEDVKAAERARAERARGNMDWLGIGLMFLGLASLQTVLEQGDQDDWFQSPFIIAMSFLAVIGIVGFIIRELTCEVPAVNLRVLRDKTFASATLIAAIMFGVLMSNMFLLPLYMQETLGFDATQSGVALLPRSLIMFVFVPVAGRLYNSVSPRLSVGFGLVMLAAGAWLEAQFTLQTGASDILWPMLLQGVGFAFLFVPLTTVSLSKIARTELTDATGLSSLIRQVGGSVGIAAFATIFARETTRARGALMADFVPTRPEVMQRLNALGAGMAQHGMSPSAARAGAVGVLNFISQQQATVLAFEKAFLLQGLLFLVSLPLLWFLSDDRSKSKSKAPSGEHLVLEI